MSDRLSRKRGVIRVTVLALGVLLLAGPVAALDLDGIKVTPFAGYTGEYDDNVFRAKDNKKDDYVNTMFGGITVEAKPDKHEVKAGYRIDLLRYTNNNNLDTERHDAFLNFILNFNRAQFRFTENFKRTDEFPTSEITNRIDRNMNLLGAGFDFDMAQIWGVGFDYSWEHNNYLGNTLEMLDRNRHTLAPNVYYKLTGKSRVFMEYNYAHEVYDSGKLRDNYDHRVLLGYRSDISERFKLTAKGGWEGLYYQNSASPYDDGSTFVGSLEMDYRPLERLGMGLIFKRHTEPSTFGNNGHYDALSAIYALTYNLTPKIMLIPRVSVGWNHYNKEVANASSGNALEKRNDIDLGAGVGLRWDPVKWLNLAVNYDFQNRSSNFELLEYNDNRVSFTVGVQM